VAKEGRRKLEKDKGQGNNEEKNRRKKEINR